MSRPFRRRAGRPGSRARLLLTAVACALPVALTGCGGASVASAPRTAGPPAAAGATYALMQMNLCLSGYGGCKAGSAYPAVVDEAVAGIRRERPDAVTVNEACRGDMATIARRTGYHLRFSRVIYAGELLSCVHPGGRGLFGDAVLTRAPVDGSDAHDFAGQAGPERRRWLCVTTRLGIDVCTSHLNTLSGVEAPGNDAQCTELRTLLARRATARPVIFGGDVNRLSSCAPAGAWTRTDRSAGQAPGLQHVYGSGGLRAPAVEVIPAANTDHDILLVRAHVV